MKPISRSVSRFTLLVAGCAVLSACQASESTGPDALESTGAVQQDGLPFAVKDIATFNEPWAMVFLPGSPYLLVTEKSGTLKLLELGGEVRDVAGVPAVAYKGQGGLGDVILAPDFATSGMIYLSWAEAGDNGTAGAAVGLGKLVINDGAPRIEGLKVIWRQTPKVSGSGHFGHRLAFSPDGRYLFISSGERQKFDPAQDMTANLGKIIRVFPDGGLPPDNPFASQGGTAAQIWSLGHRNPLGLAFDAQGRLWNQEMGPRHGDELNLVVRGANYGYPIVSNGNHYDGRDIPDHPTRPEFEAPKAYWVPAISPAGLMFYSGDKFAAWKGNAFIGGLSSEALIRVQINGDTAREAERYAMGARIREVEQGPDGSIYILEDGEKGRLRQLTPKP